MHRKIKSKNRKKLKPVDPFNVNSTIRANESQKNLPPKDDEQEVPRAFKDLFLNPDQKKRKKKKNRNAIEGYERKSWETDKQFLNRVERSTHDFVNDQLTKIKYGLVGFEPTDILDTTEKKGKRRRRDDGNAEPDSGNRKKLKTDDETEKSNKDGKKKKKEKNKKALEKKKQRKLEKLDDDVDPLYMREIIPFGTRVDEPPQLTSLPKKAKKSQQTKAGSKDLLLKRALDPSESFVTDNKRRYENDGTIKCDDLAKQRVLEEERRRVIEAYRDQKKKTRKNNEKGE